MHYNASGCQSTHSSSIFFFFWLGNRIFIEQKYIMFTMVKQLYLKQIHYVKPQIRDYSNKFPISKDFKSSTDLSISSNVWVFRSLQINDIKHSFSTSISLGPHFQLKGYWNPKYVGNPPLDSTSNHSGELHIPTTNHSGDPHIPTPLPHPCLSKENSTEASLLMAIFFGVVQGMNLNSTWLNGILFVLLFLQVAQG